MYLSYTINYMIDIINYTDNNASRTPYGRPSGSRP